MILYFSVFFASLYILIVSLIKNEISLLFVFEEVKKAFKFKYVPKIEDISRLSKPWKW